MNAKEINILLKNNTGNKDKESLIDGFVVRTKVFNNILSEIKLSKSNKPEQNYLIIGQRGAGKTTLLHRLKYAIEDDEKLKNLIIPIMLSEEQYNLMDLLNLWETLAEYLEEIEGFSGLSKTIESISNDKHTEELAYETIEKKLEEQQQKIIVFIENVDVFFKKIATKGQKRLREVLTTSSRIRLISSSTTHFEAITSYTQPFYEFFKIIQLDGLTRDESKKLLYKLAEQKNESNHFHDIIKAHPKRLESLRRLTGGNPRIISYLFHIFLDNENGKAIVDLYKLLDDITFLYKAELDQLSAQQQKVIDSIARNWDAISTKEISQKTKIDSKQVSSILNILEKNQVIEIVTTKTKNNLYRIKDRFLNIWYLMRFGKKKEIENVIWLVRFFDAWCDRSQLSDRINSYIKNLETGNYDLNAAVDMGNVYLSCVNVPHHIKYDLYQTTKSILPQKFAKDLKISEDSLDSSFKKLVKSKQWDKAEDALREIKNQEKKLMFSAWLHIRKGEIEAAIDSLKELYNLEKKTEIALAVGEMMTSIVKNGNIKYLQEAIEFNKIALKQEHWSASKNLGNLYYFEADDNMEAEKYYRIAVDHGIDEVIMRLAEILFYDKRLDESEVLVKKAISNGEKVRNNLALIYHLQGNYVKAISTLEDAIADGEYNALVSLGNLYLRQEEPDEEKALALFEQAVLKDVPGAYFNLAKYYISKDKNKEGEDMLLLGVKKHDPESAHMLAHIYGKGRAWKKSEDLFLKSAKWGRKSSVICLAANNFYDNRYEKKEFILELLEDNFELIKKRSTAIFLYCKYLVWNYKVEKATGILKDKSRELITIISENHDEEVTSSVVDGLTDFFIFLIAKMQYNAALELFNTGEGKLKDILKPVYFSLMQYMKDEFPNEYLKAGDELKETITEIVTEIEKVKVMYK